MSASPHPSTHSLSFIFPVPVSSTFKQKTHSVSVCVCACACLCLFLCSCVCHSRVNKALLAGLWADHGAAGAEGLNLIAMALGLTVKEVREGGQGCLCACVF